MYQVLKRDGKITDFNLSKITDAIKLAFEAQEKPKRGKKAKEE